MNFALWNEIAARISEHTGAPFRVEDSRPVSGGCINQAFVIAGAGQRYFVKLNEATGLDMFAAEEAGLREIVAAGAVRAPQPLCHGRVGGQAFLAMEYIETGRGNSIASQMRFGQQLAAMHRHRGAEFGWYRDNTIGSTPQINRRSDDWVEFWREHRLGFQLRLAYDRGYGKRLEKEGERLLTGFAKLFVGYEPVPVLLHGDLWSGNYDIDSDGEPVVFDPAVYYGDREADLAMTELFGGFSSHFYRAYQEVLPFDEGYPLRKIFYNLYHILNHLNLFGGGYLSQAQQMMARLNAELR